MMLLFYVLEFIFTFRIIARQFRSRKARKHRKERLKHKPLLFLELKKSSRLMLTTFPYYFSLILCLLSGAIGTQLAVIIFGGTAGWVALFVTAGILIFLYPKIKQKLDLKIDKVARAEAPSAAEVLDKEDGPPVLYLRSFSRDNLRTDSSIVSTFTPINVAHEVEIAELCWAFGPVVAVGKPNEQLPPLGAARMYFDDSEWQNEVSALMDRARLIILVLDLSEGVWWEVRQVFEIDVRCKRLSDICLGEAGGVLWADAADVGQASGEETAGRLAWVVLGDGTMGI